MWCKSRQNVGLNLYYTVKEPPKRRNKPPLRGVIVAKTNITIRHLLISFFVSKFSRLTLCSAELEDDVLIRFSPVLAFHQRSDVNYVVILCTGLSKF
jgi:hypothetical protein